MFDKFFNLPGYLLDLKAVMNLRGEDFLTTSQLPAIIAAVVFISLAKNVLRVISILRISSCRTQDTSHL